MFSGRGVTVVKNLKKHQVLGGGKGVMVTALIRGGGDQTAIQNLKVSSTAVQLLTSHSRGGTAVVLQELEPWRHLQNCSISVLGEFSARNAGSPLVINVTRKLAVFK